MHFLKKFFEAANQTAEAVNRQIFRITQRNLNAGLDLAKSLASARDPIEIAKLQASFWWKQFSEFSVQAEEVRRRLFGFGAVEPELTPEPRPREPANTSITRPRTREHQEHSVATQHLTTARPKRKPDKQKVEAPTLAARTPKAAESEVGRPKPRFQSTAEKRSTRPNPIGVKFGMLDGNAVRFTNFEAWWLVDGAWRPISPGEVLSNAAVMREARFKEVFPEVPILPRKAFQSAAEGAKKELPDG